MNQTEKEASVRSDASIDQTRRSVRRHVRAALLALVGGFALLAFVGAAPAMASFSITSLSNSITNADGTPATQAGSHPYQMVTSLSFSSGENVKDVAVNLPPGLIGNPNATPKCAVPQLDNNSCPGASQVGVLNLTASILGSTATIAAPLFNMVPPGGTAAQFGGNVLVVNSFLDVSVRTGSDYGLTTSSFNISANLPVLALSVTLWGVPTDPSHDANRTCPSGVSPCTAGNAPLLPLLTMPTACSSQLTTTAAADSWQGSASTKSYNSVDPAGNPVGVTGCGRLSFQPTISVQPDTSVADSPTGLNVDLAIPQAPDLPTSLATPALNTSVVTLPVGMALSPASSDGLQACTQSQYGLNIAAEPTCPEASKIGTVEIDSPISADPLVGSIYLAQQNNNPFGSLLAIYTSAEADGTLIKLAAKLQADPTTGQLVTTFANNPQLPFSHFKLDFFGGPRATLVTPEQCGTYTATSSETPWSDPDTASPATPSSSFSITSGCVDPFSPTFTAGVTNVQAGAFSPFVLSFSRADTDQEISGFSASLPAGVLAKLGGVPQCPSANATAGTCPASSQVGTVAVGSGAGTDPVFLPGKVYLTGPYNGGPFGLVVVVPAVSGPFNLGTVVVRQSLRVDPSTLQVTVVSDPFPTILDGIPLRMRRVDVDLNRPRFIINPTSCNPASITATLTSTSGTAAHVGSRFQVGGCAALGFSPKLKLALTGKGKTRSGNHPTLTATLTQGSGQANLRSAKVSLPLSLALDPRNSSHVCSFAVAQAVQSGPAGCPASTIVGKATAVTPLLTTTLSGPVYLVQGIRFSHGQQIRTLPSLLIPLRGQLAFNLRANTSVSGGRLVTTFGSIPDTPVSKFVLTINGGSKGLLVITGTHLNICKKTQTTGTSFGAQSGKTDQFKVKMSTPCPKRR